VNRKYAGLVLAVRPARRKIPVKRFFKKLLIALFSNVMAELEAKGGKSESRDPLPPLLCYSPILTDIYISL